ncbi:DUF3105 domain-containing protein [Gordonia sp. TBRC 11910]|uniref:DUF3105 domain-containing protein n=1 Tax=Gordonia asplenii TaxID=2725283 RepID=A0A848KT65_9ACTN|nr:DUF3105 domain-containing protein [Gordonia asplenii]NMO01187.1 DUF3105 domain-containing protein [Gordonia asplenii]
MAAKSGPSVPKSSRKTGGVPATGAKNIDWTIIAAIVAVVALLVGLGFWIVPKIMDKRDAAQNAPQTVEGYVPSVANPDPSTTIPGVTKLYYPSGVHVNPDERVAYNQSPPFGGPHDAIWANCMGIVYPVQLRSENAVHALEHGAIWITYNPDKLSADDLNKLKGKVTGQQYIFMSPYPGLSTPISLQSWGHQLKLDSPTDPRIDQFITALRRNATPGVYKDHPQETAYPETGATCGTIPGFDPSNPPAADQGAPGPNAVRMDGSRPNAGK